MTVYRAEYHAGKWQVVGTSDGINDRVNCGPRWATPREAAAYVTRMEDLRSVSPLRPPGPGSSQPFPVGETSAARTEAPARLPEVPLGPDLEPAAGFWPDPLAGSGG